MTSSHSAARVQAALDDDVEIALRLLHAREAWGQGHVVINGQGQSRPASGNTTPMRRYAGHTRCAALCTVVAIKGNDTAVDVHVGIEHVHAIQRLEERGLAGIGGADDTEDLVLL